ncbi:DUF6629 family protein [Mycolicibacterium litorale]|uniref:DUF6629 family protein n=1 Tax=Mycolicibacterium litorale TaxID=758802 RepID=UPI003CEC805E
MCFSATADLAVGAALVPVAVATLREVRHWRELPFAVLPAVFAIHQLIEAAIWPTANMPAGVVNAAVLAYLFIAFPLLPALVPVGILMLEPRGARLRVAPFVVLGLVVSAYLAVAVFTQPIGVIEHPNALEYQHGVQNGLLWAVLYVVAVLGPALLSGYPSIVAFGAINLVSVVIVAVVYVQAFASLWCVAAAIASVLVFVHMRRRRRLPDPHRYHGVPLADVSTTGSAARR